MADRPVPFRIEVPEAILADLQDRIRRTLWPVAPEVPAWDLGTPGSFMQRLVARWQDGYDWRRLEAKLNGWPNYQAEVAGQSIHFIHEKGSGNNPLPIILTHGWPGSVVEFLDLIGPLAHPERFGGRAEDGFDVIVPSLPGYGWSAAPKLPMATREIAGLWHRLMTDVLGYRDYVAQGGDWGAQVTAWLARDHKAVKAIHLNLMGMLPSLKEPNPPLSADEIAWMQRFAAGMERENGYQRIQGTKPLTLSYALTDSPVGLAAWIVEKFHGWSTDGRGDPPFTLDQLLDNVMVYWVTRSIGSSTWLYTFLGDLSSLTLPPGEKITTPTGLLFFPHDLVPPPPPEYTERVFNVAHRRYMDSGGHFAAYEKAPEMIADLRQFFSRFR